MSTQKTKKANRKVSVRSISAPVKTTPKEESIYKVEKGFPIEGVRSITNANHFPFENMGVGDSFLIPPEDKHAESPNSIHYAASRYAKMKPGFTVTTRLQLNKYRRVWRIK